MPSHYDPQIAKLSVWAPTRAVALERMKRALSEYVVTGIATNLAFHQKLIENPDFVAGVYDTGFIERHKETLLGYADVAASDEAAIAAAIALAVHRESREPRFESTPSAEQVAPWVLQHRARVLG